MRLASPELRDALAAEYVLGTLRGRARDRLERWLVDDAALRDQVQLWEELLVGFNQGIQPVAAPPQLWEAIERRLGFQASQPQKEPVVTAGLRWWRGAWLGFGITALLALALVFQPQPAEQGFTPDVQIVLQNKQQKPVWQLGADTQHNRILVSALRPIQLPDDRSLELWLLPKSGGPPISLGLMPTRMEQKRLAQVEVSLAEAAAFAVSLEPEGGSPTGAPTGPVLYVQEVGT